MKRKERGKNGGSEGWQRNRNFYRKYAQDNRNNSKRNAIVLDKKDGGMRKRTKFK